MKNNRSPRVDDFSCEFFKMFWRELGTFVLRAINYSYETGEFSAGQQDGIITLLPKENKSRHLLTNYRPICLPGHFKKKKKKVLEITRNQLVTTRNQLVITSNQLVITRSQLVITRNQLVLTRSQLVIMYNQLVITRSQLVKTRNQLVLTRSNS